MNILSPLKLWNPYPYPPPLKEPSELVPSSVTETPLGTGGMLIQGQNIAGGG